MVKANELRIGNWIGNVISDKPYKVEIIKAQAVKNGIFYTVNELLQEHLTPIPLTPEILEKCGFVSKDMADIGIFIYLKISDDITINWNQGSMWLFDYNTNIKYLHSLQNLIHALTGEELNVQL